MTIALETIAREVIAFFEAKSTLSIVALIFIDLLTGIIASVRAKRFDLQRVGAFYLTNVIPYVIGYAGLYVFTGIGLDQYLPPETVNALQPITSAPALAALAGSILDNVQRARYAPAPPHEGGNEEASPSIHVPTPPQG